MSYHDDLRAQAWHLAKRERLRPRQASLRRAISAAYYCQFHLLIDEATRSHLGTSNSRRPLRHAIGRSFTHASMAMACKSFGSGTLPSPLAGALRGKPIPPELKSFALLFVRLQEQRHLADYDLAANFNRQNVLDLLDSLERGLADWKRVRSTPATRLFLAALPLWSTMRR
jgi:hypothetical protein